MLALEKLPIRMNVEEYYAWDPGDGYIYELVDGEPRVMAPTTTVHGLLQAELCSLIRNHLRELGDRCDVVANPGVIPALLSQYNVRIPDLAVTCAPLFPGQAMLPEPVLLIEVLSPSNQAKTWTNVWAYTSIPSVLEILVLRTDRVAAELLRRSPDGAWPARQTVIAEGDLVLDSIGLRIGMAELYRRTGLCRQA